jgi:hypothetical protein
VAVTVGGILFAVAMNAQLAEAAPAVTQVPCDSAALASAIGNASDGDTLSLAHSCLYVLTVGLPVITEQLTIDGNGATLERSSARGAPAFVILQINNDIPVINDLNFRNGVPAIYLTAGANGLIINGGIFSDNNGSGAIVADDAGGAPTINGTTFTDNSSTGSGGAIFDFADAGGLSVTGTAFHDNHADGDGGAILEAGQGDLTLSHDVFSGNSAQHGGAILDSDVSDIEDTKIYDNRATEGGGLLLSTDRQDVTTLTGDDIYDNYAATGGGVAIGNSSAQLTNDTIYDNHATGDGGGIYNVETMMVFGVSLMGSEVSGNHAGADGGGIYNDEGAMSATQSQIENNVASAGGGIYQNGDVFPEGFTLTSTQVRYNWPDNCEPAGLVTGCAG